MRNPKVKFWTPERHHYYYELEVQDLQLGCGLVIVKIHDSEDLSGKTAEFDPIIVQCIRDNYAEITRNLYWTMTRYNDAPFDLIANRVDNMLDFYSLIPSNN